MKEVYLLVPLLLTSNPVQSDVQKHLKLSPHQFQIHQVSEDKYAVELLENQLGYADIEEIITAHDQMVKKIAVLQNTLRNYDWHAKEASIQASSIDSLMKKAIRYKQVKEENKKLKKLLQSQLENTEKVREETQKTMKILRDQFDTLVKEMSKPQHTTGKT